MKAKELKDKFLKFFKEKNHTIIPGSSLIPENDPTVLFTTAGMHPLVPFLLGEKHPSGRRLANVQKCLRTGDIDEVGDSWHLTFFEMLGNWSLGDYWKKEAIEWSVEFLTGKKWLAIPLEKLSVTVFQGDKNAPRDKESAKIWKDLGVPEQRIYFLPKEDNWWGPAGQTGPCGPCTEMFYDSGIKKCSPACRPGCSCGKYVEIWNDVFMEYNKTKEGKYLNSEQKNVDTGMGLERTSAVLNGFDNVFQTELFQPIIEEIKSLSQKEEQRSLKIIADHIKASVFILSENTEPSNIEQGYVLRRLIRRSIDFAKDLGIENVFCHKVAKAVIEIYKDFYPELQEKQDFIFEQLIREEEKLKETRERGITEEVSQITKAGGRLTGEVAFNLYESHGMPLRFSKKIALSRGFKIDENIDIYFEKKFKEHQKISRAGAEKKFKGGLADHTEKTVKYHTANHLLLAALRQILGNHVQQKGSNITEERLRFDFSHREKVKPEEIKKIEEIVNLKIKEDLEIKCEEMLLTEAQKKGALGVFGEKYGQRVKVYTIFNPENGKVFSKEICGGPHVKRTSELGYFKIIKEESSSAGVRRIRAVLN